MLLFLVLLSWPLCSQSSKEDRILSRDLDKRPLRQIAIGALPQRVRAAVHSLIAEERSEESATDKQRDIPATLRTIVYRIPVAPKDHRMYLVEQSGEPGCAANGPNCETLVLDETADSVITVVDDGLTEVDVIRRPHLQMPDIAAYEQEGHFGFHVTVYRFDGHTWKPYRCRTAAITEDLHPAILADKPCAP